MKVIKKKIFKKPSARIIIYYSNEYFDMEIKFYSHKKNHEHTESVKVIIYNPKQIMYDTNENFMMIKKNDLIIDMLIQYFLNIKIYIKDKQNEIEKKYLGAIYSDLDYPLFIDNKLYTAFTPCIGIDYKLYNKNDPSEIIIAILQKQRLILIENSLDPEYYFDSIRKYLEKSEQLIAFMINDVYVLYEYKKNNFSFVGNFGVYLDLMEMIKNQERLF